MNVNVAASVRRRLLNRARAERRPFDELLQYYTLERFLYRLGHSPYSRQFVLKGALLFWAWQAPLARPTRDIDLLGRTNNNVEHIEGLMRAICQEPVPEADGLCFAADSVSGERILEAADYAGVRVRLWATLGTARIRLHIDIGFDDVLVPGPQPVRLPTLLDFPAPAVQGYSRESVIAEKYQALVHLGMLNSRMKDFYDLWLLATHFAFDGALLGQAIDETFAHRQTALSDLPVAFTPAFFRDREKQAQWQAFCRRHPAVTFPHLEALVGVLAGFLLPVTRALLRGQPCAQCWLPGGPWQMA